jgi:sulfate/thiosulfate transport system permease protein
VRRNRDRWGRRLLYVLVGGYAGVVVVAPLVALLVGTFGGGLGPAARALATSSVGHALWLSFGLTLVAVAVNTVFGVIIAWVLTRDRFFGRAAVNALVDLPFAISPVIVGFCLLLLFGRGGPFARIPVKVVFAWPGMALATIFVCVPFVIRQVGLVLDQIGDDQEKAAYTLGAGPLTTFFRVTLPNLRWGLLKGVLLTTARALGEFGAVLVVSGGVADVTETGTLFVFRSLDDRRDLAAYSVSVALAAISLLLLGLMALLRRRSARDA